MLNQNLSNTRKNTKMKLIFIEHWLATCVVAIETCDTVQSSVSE